MSHESNEWTGEWDDDPRCGDPWCKDFEGHKAVHEFCGHHQIAWCRACDRGCPECAHDPHCADCGCALFAEDHDWDCAYAGDEDDEA